MATIYEVQVVSHWVNYTPKELEKILNEALKEKERKKGNEIVIEVKKRK